MSTTQPVATKVSIFGREPAFWVGLIEAVLAIALSWNVVGLDIEVVAGIMAVVVALAGVYTAYVTRDTMLGVLVGLAKAVFILLAAFQVNLTEAQTTTAIALITVVFGYANRAGTSPASEAGFTDPSPSAEIPVPVDTTPTQPSAEPPYHGDLGQTSIGVVVLVAVLAVLALFGVLALLDAPPFAR